MNCPAVPQKWIFTIHFAMDTPSFPRVLCSVLQKSPSPANEDWKALGKFLESGLESIVFYPDSMSSSHLLTMSFLTYLSFQFVYIYIIYVYIYYIYIYIILYVIYIIYIIYTYAYDFTYYKHVYKRIYICVMTQRM